jgi:glucose/arabinose dehydrogenase
MRSTGKNHKRTNLLFWTGLLFLLLSACSSPSTQSTSSTIPASPSDTPTVSNLDTSTQDLPATSTAVPTQSSSPSPSSTSTPTESQPSVTALPDASLYTWAVVASGLDSPVGLVNAGDGSGRLFVVEKSGLIEIIKNGEVAPGPFLDIRDIVGSTGSEQGLLGLAFDPQYQENGYFYVNYTDIQGNTVIARYSVTSFNADRADAESEKRLIYVDQPFANHNGGEMVFGPDGYLYIGLGDGGSGGDPHGNGQSTNTLLGKILRIDVDHGDPYSVPVDNPFVNGGGNLDIWAYGLRNPWRFSFDLLTHDLYIGDVGQDMWEEIDFLLAGSPGGSNFGWNYMEGTHPYQSSPPAGLKLIPPVAEYSHNNGCSVTGGYVYRGKELPDWQGVYLYGDYCSGKVWGLLHMPDGSWKNALLFETTARISSFGEDEAGEIYLVDISGTIYRLSRSS